MITREIAILLSYPEAILEPRVTASGTPTFGYRLGPAADTDARRPITHRPKWRYWQRAADDLRTVPVFENEWLRIGDNVDDARLLGTPEGIIDQAQDAFCIEDDGGLVGERVFGFRGVGRERPRVRVQARGGKDAAGTARARARIDRAAHVIACSTRCHIPTDWWTSKGPPPVQGPDGSAPGFLDVSCVTFGEVNLNPVTSIIAEDERPIFMFTVEIVRWRSKEG